MATCDYCGDTFVNPLQLGPHKRRCWPRHCVHVCSDFSVDDDSHDDDSNDASDDVNDDVSQLSAPAQPSPPSSPARSPPARPRPLYYLAQRRRGCEWGLDSSAIMPRIVVRYNRQATHDYTLTQCMWRAYVDKVAGLCLEDFWLLYGTVQHVSTACADKVLTEVHRMLQQRSSKTLGHKWPRSLRCQIIFALVKIICAFCANYMRFLIITFAFCENYICFLWELYVLFHFYICFL